MSPQVSQSEAMQRPSGRVFRARWLKWSLMDSAHFDWLSRVWFATGYERALEEIAAGPTQNWAPAIRAAIESAGFTVQEMPEDLDREQALAMLADLNRQIERMKIA